MSEIRGEALAAFMTDAGVDQWGVAACPPSPWPYAPALPFAISLGIRIDPAIIAEVEHGPTAAYLAEYERLNVKLRATTEDLAALLRERGAAAELVQPTVTDDLTVPDLSLIHISEPTRPY